MRGKSPTTIDGGSIACQCRGDTDVLAKAEICILSGVAQRPRTVVAVGVDVDAHPPSIHVLSSPILSYPVGLYDINLSLDLAYLVFDMYDMYPNPTQFACGFYSILCCVVCRFKDGTRVKCRVLASLPSHHQQQQGGSKRRSRKGLAADSDSNSNSSATEANAGPVELSLRESRLDEALDVSEATKREEAPEVGSTAKVFFLFSFYFLPIF